MGSGSGGMIGGGGGGGGNGGAGNIGVPHIVGENVGCAGAVL